MDIGLKARQLKAKYMFYDKHNKSSNTSYCCFDCTKKFNITVKIEQRDLDRIICIISNDDIEVKEFYRILTELERLLLIFDGIFPTLKSIELYGGGKIEDYDKYYNCLHKGLNIMIHIRNF